MRDGLGSVQSVLVLGGASDIGLATAAALVHDGTSTVVLAARRPDRLETPAAELRRRGASVDLVEFDANALETHGKVLGEVFVRHDDLDVVLVAFGVLPEATSLDGDPDAALEVLRTNTLGAASAVLRAAERLHEQGHGTLVVLSSVAGERVRRSNPVYGASKAGLDALALGLGDRLHGSGVRIMVVRPGFVRSRMTAGLAAAPLAVRPADVARAIVAGLRRGADVVWVPPVLRWVMVGVRHLPRFVFRRIDIWATTDWRQWRTRNTRPSTSRRLLQTARAGGPSGGRARGGRRRSRGRAGTSGAAGPGSGGGSGT
jgi:decaprenylphospho-beta-D-erythro-pentofuranosid-2-ulose 2-reductase